MEQRFIHIHISSDVFTKISDELSKIENRQSDIQFKRVMKDLEFLHSIEGGVYLNNLNEYLSLLTRIWGIWENVQVREGGRQFWLE